MSDPHAERAWTLLQIGRFDDALEAAGEVLRRQPDDAGGLVVAGTCLVHLDRLDDADRLWQRATAVHPTNIEVAVLGVRCAWMNTAELWRRAERLRTLDPNHSRVLFWFALAAARTKRPALASEALARLHAVDPVADTVRRAEAWVDLISSEQAGRPAIVTERIVTELLAKDPNSAEAHDLRLRAAQLRSSRRRGRRDAALAEVKIIRDAAAAGVHPPPGRLRAVTEVAVGEPALGFAFVGLAWLGALAVDGAAMPWTLAAVFAAVAWVSLLLAAWRRVARLVLSLPAVGRARMLRPVVRSGVITGAVVAVAGFAALVYLRPYDEQRAAALGFATSTEERTVVDYVDITIPRLPAPPLPGVPGPTTPRVTTPPIRTPQISTVTTEVFDADRAVALIRYWAAIGGLAIGAGSGLVGLAFAGHRGGRLRGP